jgi:hypothetical protein
MGVGGQDRADWPLSLVSKARELEMLDWKGKFLERNIPIVEGFLAKIC